MLTVGFERGKKYLVEKIIFNGKKYLEVRIMFNINVHTGRLIFLFK